jgi:capsule polysaccharide export protein KpsE/RkpR
MGRLSLTEAQQRRAFFENKIIEAKAELALADKALRSTGINESTLKSSPLVAVELIAKLKGAITAQEIKVGGMRGYFNEYAPEIKQSMLELANLKNQLTKAERNDSSLNIGKLEDSYVERYREYKYKETLYEMFAKQYELAKVDEAREGAFIQVIDLAINPEFKSRPRKGLIAIMTTLGSAFALLFFVLIRQKYVNTEPDSKYAKKIEHLKKSWLKAFGRG